VQETLAITDKTYLMFGRILKAGVPEELVEDEMVRRILRTNFELRKKKLEF
jgi:lipopolysaccharide export system ATP-binding protein